MSWSNLLLPPNHVPLEPSLNGLAGRTIQTLKKLLNEALRDGNDAYLSVLHYRNTPVVGNASPAQLIFGRRTRTTLPTTQKLLTPKVQGPLYVREMLNYNQDLQKNYYDRNTKSLLELDEGNTVRIKDKSSKKEWKKAVVVAPRSYIVHDESGQL